MGATVTNLIAGAGDLYTAPFGSTEPASTLVALQGAPASPWSDVGGTQDGVNMTIAQEFFELEVDQIVDSPGRRLTKRDFSLQANMAEPTLDNLALGMNASAGVTAGTGLHTLEPTTDTSAQQPEYCALLFDGYAPEQLRRRVIGRRMLSTDNIEFAYKKGEQTIFTVTWMGHYVSASIKPFTIIDEDPA